MKNSRKDNKKSERYSTLSGVVLTVTLHALAFVFVSFTGLKYIYPPPEEKSILIDFSEDIVEPQQYKGAEPMSDEIDLQNPVKLAQRSESPQESNSPNLTPETTPDDFGDVPVPVPETESKARSLSALYAIHQVKPQGNVGKDNPNNLQEEIDFHRG